jgi:hypothetical protein
LSNECADVGWVNVLVMFGPASSERDREIAAACDADPTLSWLAGRRPAAEAFFRPRISGIWDVFVIVGPARSDSWSEPAAPSETVRATFSDFLLAPPALVLVDDAARLWPAWDEWQRVVRGDVATASVECLSSEATAHDVAAAARLVGLKRATKTISSSWLPHDIHDVQI